MLLLILGASLLAAEPAPQPDQLRRVLGVPRQPDADLFFLRDGTRQTGLVGQAAFRLHTAHGDLLFPTTTLAALDLADDRTGLCSAITETGDRLSGFLSEPGVGFRSPDGAGITDVRIGSVLKLVFRVRPSSTLRTSPSSSPDCLVRLRNGDFFIGRVAAGRWVSTNDHAALDWTNAAVLSVTFPEAGTNVARVVLQDGEVVSALPAAEDLRFDLAAGLELTVLAARIEQLQRVQAGMLPPDLRARIGVPTTDDETRPTQAAPPDTRVVPCPGMVWIPAGEFRMGSPPEEPDRDLDEGPLTRVVFPWGFWIGRYEVSQADYQLWMGRNPSQYQYEGETLHPVERVSWLDAADYCRRLTEREHAAGNIPQEYTYRLPTEAEWEYACRAGTSTRFSFGDDDGYAQARDHIWFSRNSGSATHPVGTKKPNPWGLHDMHGNVLEWCLDAWRGSLPGGTVTNVAPLPDGTLRAVRGGSWLYDARYARSANRDSYGALVRCSDLGFRVALVRSGEGVP